MPKPTAPPAPQRSVRVPDDTWEPAMKRADADGVYLAEIINAALRDYRDGGYVPSIVQREAKVTPLRNAKTAKRKTVARKSTTRSRSVRPAH